MQATEGTQTEGLGTCYCGKSGVTLYSLRWWSDGDWYQDATTPDGASRHVYQRPWCGEQVCRDVLRHQLYVKRAERKLDEATRHLDDQRHLLATAIRMFNAAQGASES